MADTLLEAIDHLVYATTDLESSVDDLEHRLGVRAAPGGRHPGRGTRNALIALSNRSYLEIVGPDPEQPPPRSPRWFGIDALAAPRLVTWAARTTDLGGLVAAAARQGVALGPVGSGARQATDGASLRWQFTDPTVVVADGLVPFFIDWGTSPHPAQSAPRGPRLLSMRAVHPDPDAVRRMLSALTLALPVEPGPRPALVATLRTKSGEIELQ